jgi:hypothetical protein
MNTKKYQVEEDREVQVILESKIRHNMEQKFHGGMFYKNNIVMQHPHLEKLLTKQ